MSQEPSGLFHEQLLAFLQEDLLRKKKEEGWDDRFDPQVRDYSDALSRAVRTSAPMPLDQIVEKYQHLFSGRGPVHLEQKILQAFSDSEMQRCGLPRLRMVRGLPRQYHQNSIAISKIKSDFSYLPALLKTAGAKAIFSLYSEYPVPRNAKVTILTWVIPDGLGDFYASIHVARVIKNAFPFLEIHLFAISEKELASVDDISIALWDGSESQLNALRGSDLILQMPTHYPKIDEIQAQVERIASDDPMPKWESVGQYGYIESDNFHPRTKAHCMGLHFLEKGVLIRKPAESFSILDLQNAGLLRWMFGQDSVSDAVVAKYRKHHRFFLGYLFSEAGIFIYLHALLKSLENDAKDVDVCFPDASRVISYFASRIDEKKDLIEKRYGVQTIALHIGAHRAESIGPHSGKTLRIFCPETIDSTDFQRLVSFSEDFVGCRGDQSFSDAVSHNKCFFYEPRDHSRFFVKDLIALGENRISSHPSAMGILRLFGKVLDHHLPPEEGEWVDEISIQRSKMIDWMQIAEEMGTYLQDPTAHAGFKKLNRIIQEEYSCNEFFIQLTQRAICHRRRPQIERAEEREINRFIRSEQSFAISVERIRHELANESFG